MSDPQTPETGETIWSQLRRRKVGQWGVGYVALAWGFLQGLEYVGEAFGWPAGLRRIAILVLLSGLPIVLVIAWYHGDRGHQRLTRSEALILGVLVLLGGGLTWRYHDAGEAPAAAPAAASAPNSGVVAPRPVDPRPSVAVLPFENRSAAAEDAFFADGVHDDILSRLGRIGALRVIARTSVAHFRDTRIGMREVAATLGVGTLVTGSVQRAANRVRISVQLVDTASDSQLWAENYDRELNAESLFDIQSEVAGAIAEALKAELVSTTAPAGDSKLPTRSLEAWQAFQQGEQAGLEEAPALFQRAIDLDPQFAEAHVALARVLLVQVYHRGARRDVNLPRAEAAVEAALLLDPQLAEAWLALGDIALDERAESSYRKALELNPNLAPAYEKLSDLLREDGRWEEALEHAEKAAALDPLSLGVNESLAFCYETLQRFDEAEKYYRKVVEIAPDQPHLYLNLANFLAYVRDNFVEAVSLAERAMALAPDNAYLPAQLASLYQDLGDDVSARRLLDAALPRWPDRTNLLAAHGWLSTRQGNQIAAVRAARRLLESNPRHSGAIVLLAHADLQRKDYPAARERFAAAYPELLAEAPPTIDRANYGTATFLAAILLKTGEIERAKLLLDGSEAALQTVPRLGLSGYDVSYAKIHALRGDRVKALAELRATVDAGWRGPYWPIILELDPALAPIRRDPEFRAIVEIIEKDMAQQRKELEMRRGSGAQPAGS